jgi:hypothetical protein
MRALVCTSPGEVQLREEPDPEARPDEELLTVLASGIYGIVKAVIVPERG